MDGIGSVSYTHLDVYKRQTLQRTYLVQIVRLVIEKKAETKKACGNRVISKLA